MKMLDKTNILLFRGRQATHVLRFSNQFTPLKLSHTYTHTQIAVNYRSQLKNHHLKNNFAKAPSTIIFLFRTDLIGVDDEYN